ncbi:hypothetical protein Pyrfu_0132 [Pyrolobus fumarii 1A]|uniref:Uncharacterized protein n=1 Tax=Pyrolobus fumarii (strain DSM 11204 / 1A) TaxID=694429 RepID=G0EEG3_PYRF1|nr:hypothetical protein [Pyrolobus fumarii]AEM38004.1 hypothetical protein Pyrfu_0132 [Pyrolobus fumarii 1A]
MAEKRDPVEAFLAALRIYLKERGHMLFSFSGAGSQTIVRLALRGLWRRHDTSTGYIKFMDAVREIRRNPEALERLREYGILQFEVFEGEPYAIVDLRRLRRLYEEALKEED